MLIPALHYLVCSINSVLSILSNEEPIIKIDEMRSKVLHLEALYQQKLTALNELKQSILHKAFTGELTADKADLKTNIEREAISA